MANVTVADVMVDTLVAAGVKRICGVVGDSLNGITDSLRRKKNIRWVHVRREKECSVFCEMVSSPEQMPRLLKLAMQAAVSRLKIAMFYL
jgi:thiamine pyrophosphate-dependent acetolactate synthase large subunit-like protein